MNEWDGPVATEDEEVDTAGRRGPLIAAVLVVVAIVGFLVVVLATSEPAANRIAESPLVGRDAPAVVGTTLEGETVDVTQWRGAPVVLNTWFAACGPCRVEAPDLAAVAEETAADGVRFLGINTRDGAAQALAFEEEFGVEIPDDAAEKISTVKDAIDYIEAHKA